MSSQPDGDCPRANLRTMDDSGKSHSDQFNADQDNAIIEIAILLEGIARIIRSGGRLTRVHEIMYSDLSSTAKQIYSLRRKRVAIMKEAAIADGPAWDILLDLFVHMDEKKAVSVTSAAIGASCPPTTALRWIQVLQEKDLIVRIDDPSDHRRTFIELSPHGREIMIDVLSLYTDRD